MKIFLDANILVSVLNKEYPGFSYTSRVLSLADNKDYKVFTSPLCLAIAFYFAEKKSGTSLAREKVNLLSEKLHITTIGQKTMEAVRKNRNIHDIEDGLQYYSALESGCKCIVTEDQNDFYFSDINVLSARQFIEHYLLH